MGQKDVNCERKEKERLSKQKSEDKEIRRIRVKVSVFCEKNEEVKELGLKFMDKYVKGSVNPKNIIFV
jgi:hypothetical protein